MNMVGKKFQRTFHIQVWDVLENILTNDMWGILIHLPHHGDATF